MIRSKSNYHCLVRVRVRVGVRVGVRVEVMVRLEMDDPFQE
jgi:hypothetical protein